MHFGSKGDLFLRHDLTCVQITFIYLHRAFAAMGTVFMPLNYLFSFFFFFFFFVWVKISKEISI